MSTPNLNLFELANSQINPENSLNSNNKLLDTIVQLAVESVALTDPPGSPVDGARYIPAATATGSWVGQENKIAYYWNGWNFITPVIGWILFDVDTSTFLYWNGSIWDSINTTIAPTNPLVDISEKTANYTVTSTDSGKVITVNAAGAITITLPESSTEVLEEGFNIAIVRRGAGTVTIAKEGSDVIESIDSLVDIGNRYGSVSVIKVEQGSPNTWTLVGDLG